MRLEALNISKYRDGSAPGDDVPLVLPGAVYGVFDGATDPKGTVVDGVDAGRLAATIVASEMAAIALEPGAGTLPGKDIVNRLSIALKTRTDPLALEIPPSTTLAVALDCGATWRFLLLGDSGIRLNGAEVFHHEKRIDLVSTLARVALFSRLCHQHTDLDEAERLSRKGIFLGFENAVLEGMLSTSDAKAIVESTVAKAGMGADRDIVERFLMGGIQTQHRFGNATGNPLCFDTMNGTDQQLNELQDFERAKSTVSSIELFTDGYPSIPPDVSVAAWESAFHSAEAQDFHKTGRFATVKGSTSTEFYDDRTVIVLGGISAG